VEKKSLWWLRNVDHVLIKKEKELQGKKRKDASLTQTIWRKQKISCTIFIKREFILRVEKGTGDRQS